MNDKLLFFVALALIFIGLFAFAVVKSGKGLRFFSDREGKGALFSALSFVAILGGAVFLFGCSNAKAEDKGEWFEYGKIYMGLDYTRKISPQCEDEGPSNRLTGNGGFEAGFYSFGDFGSYVKYTHHSCAVSPDDKSYDALGFGIEYKLW